MCEIEIVSCRVLNNKSYYHCFTAIKFAKPSWRSPQSVIPFIANPTKFVEKYRTARIYSPWRFLPPRNTPDSFCRRFTRQNHRCAAWAVFFFYGKSTLKISWADRTCYRLFVNAAAQTGAGTSFGANGDQHTRAAELSTYFLRLNNSETFVENAFWA